MSKEREPFIFDPGNRANCERLEALSHRRTMLLGKVAGSRALEIGLIINAGFALTRKDLPRFALSAIGAAFFHRRANTNRDKLDEVNANLDGYHEFIGTDEATYNQALYRHLVEDGDGHEEEAA